jgi:hypothetical protein
MPPKGPLDSALFPGIETRDVATRITGYIATAIADPRVVDVTPEETQDALIRPLVRYFAFRDVWIALSTKPASVAITEKGSSAFLIQQIDNIKTLMDEALDEFEDAIPEAGPEPLFPDTMSTKTDVTWYAGRSASG